MAALPARRSCACRSRVLKPYAGLLCLALLAYGVWYLVKKMRTIIV
jgi:hypothetical protein